LVSPGKPGNIIGQANSIPVVGASSAKIVEIASTLSVKQLAESLHVTPVDIIKQLMRLGIMANINQIVDFQSAASVAAALGFEAHQKVESGRKAASAVKEMRKQQLDQNKDQTGLKSRPPIVTVMGHVDHGKTKLLDAIRSTNVVASEAGGITQHIGAYQVDINGQKITFLDTPGHQAFTAMRARGAQITDIAVLVVAADDGVMPQTLEAIDHAKAAGVPIVVALNKIDKPEANPDRVKQQLAEAGLVVEDWGGDIICVPVSAKENKGISDLLENILLVAEIEDLKGDPNRSASGVVIEAKLDKTKGPVATVLVHNGTLRVGDVIVIGTSWGRLKAMYNDTGKQVKKAGPSSPVEILGLNSVPQAGEIIAAAASEQQAKALIEKRQQEQEEATRAISLANLFEQLSAGKVKELAIVLKTDVQGSIEPIKASLEQLSTDEVKVRVIRSGSGSITESDVLLAIASKGIIMGFNTDAEPGAKRLAENEGISIRRYDVIYGLVDDVRKALKGMLAPVKVEVVEGRAEIITVFPGAKGTKIAGVRILEGKASRGSSVRIFRKDKKIIESNIDSLRRFKDDVKEVAAGFEAGIVLNNFNDYHTGDTLQFFKIEVVV
jgi:translation initiation factor IF-2